MLFGEPGVGDKMGTVRLRFQLPILLRNISTAVNVFLVVVGKCLLLCAFYVKVYLTSLYQGGCQTVFLNVQDGFVLRACCIG